MLVSLAGKLKIAVVTGEHPFQVPEFHALFRSYSDLECYIQPLEDFVGHDFERFPYDAVVFYHFHQETPENAVQNMINQLCEAGIGIIVLHHALLAFPHWEYWSHLCGIEDRSFTYHPNQAFTVHIANTNPITNGITEWEMHDETYNMISVDPEEAEILLTVEHENSMSVIGWARVFKRAKVFCYQSGHDSTAYGDPNFREVLRRGIRWAAEAEPEKHTEEEHVDG